MAKTTIDYQKEVINNVKKSELFTELREMWNGKNPNQIIEHMKPFQVPFMAIDYGTQGEFSQEIDILTDNLYRFKCPSAIYSFIIKLLFEFKNETLIEVYRGRLNYNRKIDYSKYPDSKPK